MRYLFGRCRLDVSLRELQRDDASLHVEPQVLDLIIYLIENRDRVIGRDELFDSVWQGRIVSESALRSSINAARSALGDSGRKQSLIRTLPRKGFRFVSEVKVEDGGRAAAATADRLAKSVESPSVPEFDQGGRPVVAVLPFRNLSGNPEWEHYADGMTEDVTTALTKHRWLLVVARNSAFAFKDRDEKLQRVGIALGAGYVVEGSLHKLSQRLRVTAHLVDSVSARVLWAESYDIPLEEVFDVQDDITGMIASHLEPQIGTEERRRVASRNSRNFRAWDLFHLGNKHLYKATPQDNREAQRLLRLAVEYDPELAQGHALLAYAIVLSMLYFDAEPDQALLKEAQVIAHEGIERDDQDALIRFVYGRVLLARKRYASALEELRYSVDMNPALAIAHCGIGDSLAYEGRFEECFPHFQRAIDLSRHDPQRWAFYAYRALAHLFAGEFDESLDWASRATHVPNCHFWPYSHRVSALGHLGHHDEAKEATLDLLEQNRGFTCATARKRLFYLRDHAQVALYLEGLRKAGLPP
ncbi:MAG: winged helix-turn-helix domain-containing tetratricopeptide repeat protein [Rhodovibrionaceae bacterium]